MGTEDDQSDDDRPHGRNKHGGGCYVLGFADEGIVIRRRRVRQEFDGGVERFR